ncbi:MAG: GAF domain-containing protein [Deltaproteobacteria bacterium]|nr:GAF domain-containing protein [Deltaproteobacteria bacterium]
MAVEINYFKTICKVSKAFGSTLSQSKLLDLIVTSAIETMNAKAACLFLADENEDVFIPVAQKGLSDKYLHAQPLHAKKIVGAVLKGGYLAIRDATKDPRVENHAMKKAEGIASILDVPVMVRDKAIGILALYTAEPRDFSEDEIDFLSALAEHGGRAIEIARLLERIRRNSTLFLDLAANINSSLDIKKILHNMTADICEAFGIKGVLIRLLNKQNGNLELVASYGLSEDFLNKGPVAAQKTLSKILKGETVVIGDIETEPSLEYRDAVRKEGIVSMLVVPIKVKDEVIGIMRLCSGVKREYSDDLIMLVTALAQTGGLAIQNAAMYLALQNDMRDLKEDIWSHRSWF